MANLRQVGLACAVGAALAAVAPIAAARSRPGGRGTVVTVAGCLQHDEHYGNGRSFVLVRGSMSPLGGPGRGDRVAPPSPPATPEPDVPGEPGVRSTPPGTPGGSRIDTGANGGGTGAGGVTYVLAPTRGLTRYLGQRLEVTGTLRLEPNRAAPRTPKGLGTMPPGASGTAGTVPPGQTLDVMRFRPLGEPCS